MNYLSRNIDRAIVHALGMIHDVESCRTAKTLEVVPDVFFRKIAGDGLPVAEVIKPPEHCYIGVADIDAIQMMCEYLRHDTVAGDRGYASFQFELIGEIVRKSERLMASFWEAHKAGNYKRNPDYLRPLDDTNSWGRSMIVMRKIFLANEERSRQADA